MTAIDLEHLNNVRDLGGIPVADGRFVAPGLFYRGGSLFGAEQSDLDTLFVTRGVKVVIDIRIGYERNAKPDPEVDGVENLFIPFYDNDIVGYEYFKPVPGTIVNGKDFACDPNDFYRDLANKLTTKQIRQSLHIIFDSAMAGKPVFFHCSNGKDRAGILSLLILEILGAAEDAILDDYLLTNISRDKGIDRIYQRFLKLCQGDEAFAKAITEGHRARPENLVAYREAVDERYGSMQDFIRDVLGFSDQDIALYREKLTGSTPA